jgi:excisionase family DNA binding protein
MKKTKSATPKVHENLVFLTVEEAADFLRISRVSIYRWIAQGRLKKFKVGSRTLLRRDDVHALISEAAATQPTTAA